MDAYWMDIHPLATLMQIIAIIVALILSANSDFVTLSPGFAVPCECETYSHFPKEHGGNVEMILEGDCKPVVNLGLEQKTCDAES